MQQYLNFYISFAIVDISSGPPFLKSSVTLLRLNVFAGQSPTFPTIKPIRIYTFRIFTWDVDRKKDQDRPYLNHLGKNSGAPNVNFWKISVRKTIWDLEFLEHLL